MKKYPLLFGYRGPVQGNGFFANVAVNGRGLMVEEEGDFWVYGVNPGGLAGGGEDQHAALEDFRRTYYSVLFDIAAEAESFDDFEAQVSRFFHETSRRYEKEWKEAVEKVRSGELDLEWAPKKSADNTRVDIEVVEIRMPSPSENHLDQPAELAA